MNCSTNKAGYSFHKWSWRIITGPFGVAARAKKKKVPVIVLAGQIPLKIEKKMHDYFNGIFSINHASSSVEDTIKNTSADLTRVSCELGHLLAFNQK